MLSQYEITGMNGTTLFRLFQFGSVQFVDQFDSAVYVPVTLWSVSPSSSESRAKCFLLVEVQVRSLCLVSAVAAASASHCVE